MEKADLYTKYLCGVITESQYIDATDELMMPKEIESMTPDQVSEIDDIDDETSKELLDVLNKAKPSEKHSAGWDYSSLEKKEETPEKEMPDFWSQLSDKSKENIITAVNNDPTIEERRRLADRRHRKNET